MNFKIKSTLTVAKFPTVIRKVCEKLKTTQISGKQKLCVHLFVFIRYFVRSLKLALYVDKAVGFFYYLGFCLENKSKFGKPPGHVRIKRNSHELASRSSLTRKTS